MATASYYDRIDFKAITGLSDSLITRRLRALAEQVLTTWKSEAAAALHTTAQDYINNLSIAEFEPKSFKVVLGGTVPNMMEQGMGPGGVGTTGRYDLRTFILKDGTRSLRRAKDGRLYVNIPFRHGMPALKEHRLGARAKNLNATHTGDMWRPPFSNLVDPKEQQVRVFHMNNGRKVSGYGGRLPAGSGAKRQWWWHSHHLAGLVRMQRTYSKTTQSEYMTWRRIIQWSAQPGDAEQAKWFHPGIEPRKLAEKVMFRMDDMIKAFFGPEA